MKKLGKIISIILLVVALVPVYLYFSFRTSKPRNLGVSYTQEDLSSGRGKSQIVYEEISQSNTNGKTRVLSGVREVDTTFTSSEMTAIMNNKPGIYYPYTNVQVKFNGDGTGEISGNLIKSRIPTYANTFGAPQQAVDLAMKFLPDNPSFYLKGGATLVDNKVGIFEPIKFEIGRVSLPLGLILANNHEAVNKAYAMDVNGLLGEISQVTNKKQLIIDFINSRLSMIEGFYAADAHFEENKLIYKGTLPEKESTVR